MKSLIEETTIYHPKELQSVYRFYESGHKCGIKVSPYSFDRRIKCDCSVHYWQIKRNIFNKIWFKFKSFIKNNNA